MAKEVLYMNSFRDATPVANDYITYPSGGTLDADVGHPTKLGFTPSTLPLQVPFGWKVIPAVGDVLLDINLTQLDSFFTATNEIVVSFSNAVLSGSPTMELCGNTSLVLNGGTNNLEFNFIQISLTKPSNDIIAIAYVNKSQQTTLDLTNGLILKSTTGAQHYLADLSIVKHDTSPGLINEQFIITTPASSIVSSTGYINNAGTTVNKDDIDEADDDDWVGTTTANAELEVGHGTADLSTIKAGMDTLVYDPSSLKINGISLTTSAKVQGDITKIVQGYGSDTEETVIDQGSDAIDSEYTSTTTFHDISEAESAAIQTAGSFNTTLKFTKVNSIVASPLSIYMDVNGMGSPGDIIISLLEEPLSDTTVTITSPDAPGVTASQSVLVFNTTNFNVSQIVSITTSNAWWTQGNASIITLSSPGMLDVTVTVNPG